MDRRKLISTVLTIAAAAVGLWLFVAFALPIVLPFLLAFALAMAVAGPADGLARAAHLPRWLAAGVCVAGFYVFAGLCLFFLGRTALGELSSLVADLPALLTRTTAPLTSVRDRLIVLLGRLPDGFGTAAADSVRELFESGAGLAQKAGEWLLRFASDTAAALPGIVLFILTTVTASFMAAAELPRLRGYLARHLPEPWKRRLTAASSRLKSVFGGWLRAQARLMGVTFAIVTVGFLLLRVSYPLLLGILVALVDALPVLGTGTILIPWALILFLRGESVRGVAFLLLYGAAALTRTTLEPRLVGRGIGLAPLLTLAAIYTGFRLCGVVGMILFPIAAIFLKQFWDHARRAA